MHHHTQSENAFVCCIYAYMHIYVMQMQSEYAFQFGV